MIRAVAIKPCNSEVLGHGVSGYFLDWWFQCADWRGALPCKTDERAHAPLNVRCKRWWRWDPKERRKVLWRDGSEWYRVRPARVYDCSTIGVERVRGVWRWVP